MQKTLKKFLVFENSASIQRNPNKKRVISVFSERFFNRLRPKNGTKKNENFANAFRKSSKHAPLR